MQLGSLFGVSRTVEREVLSVRSHPRFLSNLSFNVNSRVTLIALVTLVATLSVRKTPVMELRRLHTDLIYCYKIVFGLTDLMLSDYFQMAPLLNTRGHRFKLYKKRYSAIVRSKFFS